MKKNILSILIISMLFMSCSSNDGENDDNTTGIFKSSFYVGEEKQDVIELISGISYDKNSKTMNVILMGENENKKLKQFHASFEDIVFNTLKVGNDLVQKADMVNYILGVNKDSGMYSMVKGPYDTNYKNYIRKAIVKSIDISKKYMEIDFQNATVVGGTDKSRVEKK